MKNLVIFDLDGTLLNTISDLGNAANHALGKAGLPTHPLQSYPRFVGNGVRKLMERVVPQSMRDPETIDRLLVDFKEYYGNHLTDCTEPYPGIPELLRDLSARGVRLAVASNKYQQAVGELIGHFFPDIPLGSSGGAERGHPRQTRPFDSLRDTGKIPHPQVRSALCRRLRR